MKNMFIKENKIQQKRKYSKMKYNKRNSSYKEK